MIQALGPAEGLSSIVARVINGELVAIVTGTPENRSATAYTADVLRMLAGWVEEQRSSRKLPTLFPCQ